MPFSFSNSSMLLVPGILTLPIFLFCSLYSFWAVSCVSHRDHWWCGMQGSPSRKRIRGDLKSGVWMQQGFMKTKHYQAVTPSFYWGLCVLLFLFLSICLLHSLLLPLLVWKLWRLSLKWWCNLWLHNSEDTKHRKSDWLGCFFPPWVGCPSIAQ